MLRALCCERYALVTYEAAHSPKTNSFTTAHSSLICYARVAQQACKSVKPRAGMIAGM